MEARELEHLLGAVRRDEPAPRGGDEADRHGPHLPVSLVGMVCGTQSYTPVSASDRDDVELGEDHGALDGVRNLLARLDAEADVAVLVSDDDESLEAHALTRGGLLLHGHDLHHLVGELAEEVLHDLVLLDGDGEEVDLLEGGILPCCTRRPSLVHGVSDPRAWRPTCRSRGHRGRRVRVRRGRRVGNRGRSRRVLHLHVQPWCLTSVTCGKGKRMESFAQRGFRGVGGFFRP